MLLPNPGVQTRIELSAVAVDFLWRKELTKDQEAEGLEEIELLFG